MPIYEYACPQCGWNGELLARSGDRDQQSCAACGALLAREEIALVAQPDFNPYQMKAIIGPAGQRVPGHFGKSAKRKRRPR